MAAMTSPSQKASLYVGDLHPDISATELREAFARIVPVASVRLCRDKLSGKSLQYAYLNFFSPSDASKALACLNYTSLNGKPMRIMYMQRNPITRKSGVGNLFVKNLHYSIGSARLQSIFCRFGTVLSCKVAEEGGRNKGFGFVQFEAEESAKAALDALNETTIEGKNICISKFLKKSDRKPAKEGSKYNLYVKNFGEDVTEDLLREKFSEHGEVYNAVIMKNSEGKSRGFGFVSFYSPESAKKAEKSLNGALLGSKNLFVGKAQKKDERQLLLKLKHDQMLSHKNENMKASNLYVKNLDLSIDDSKLREHFSVFGEVVSAKVMCFDNGASKGFGFVSFSTPEEANKALGVLHGSIFKGRYLYVAIAQRKEDRQKILQHHFAQILQRDSQFSHRFPNYFPSNTISQSKPGQPYEPRPYMIDGQAYPYLPMDHKGLLHFPPAYGTYLLPQQQFVTTAASNIQNQMMNNGTIFYDQKVYNNNKVYKRTGAPTGSTSSKGSAAPSKSSMRFVDYLYPFGQI